MAERASAIAAVDIVVNMELLDEEVIKLQVAKIELWRLPEVVCEKSGEDKFEQHTPPDEGSSGFEKYKAQDLILSFHDRQWMTSELISLGTQEGLTESTMKRAISGLVQAW
jgi:hypothetical protein